MNGAQRRLLRGGAFPGLATSGAEARRGLQFFPLSPRLAGGLPPRGAMPSGEEAPLLGAPPLLATPSRWVRVIAYLSAFAEGYDVTGSAGAHSCSPPSRTVQE